VAHAESSRASRARVTVGWTRFSEDVNPSRWPAVSFPNPTSSTNLSQPPCIPATTLYLGERAGTFWQTELIASHPQCFQTQIPHRGGLSPPRSTTFLDDKRGKQRTAAPVRLTAISRLHDFTALLEIES